jgi:uncharacterized membrane protein (DUF2068 family)
MNFADQFDVAILPFEVAHFLPHLAVFSLSQIILPFFIVVWLNAFVCP